MDYLARFIIRRFKQAFHPYIPQGAGWRRYPSHVASLLEYLEPLHIIVIGPTWVGVDGAFVDDPRSHREKLRLAVEAAEAVFGEAEGRAEAGNLGVFRLNTGLTRFHLYWGPSGTSPSARTQGPTHQGSPTWLIRAGFTVRRGVSGKTEK